MRVTSSNVRNSRTLLVTGAGLIGSSFTRELFADTWFRGASSPGICLTYAGKLENLSGHIDSHRQSALHVRAATAAMRSIAA